MKKVYVLMRVLILKDKTQVRYPVGVYTDQEDAHRASNAFTGALNGLTPEAQQLLSFLGIAAFGGVVVEQDFTAGAGLVTADRPSIILPG